MMRALPGSIALLAVLLTLAGGDLAVAASTGPSSPAYRHTALSVSPLPGDLAILELQYGHAGRAALTRRSLALAVSGPFGDDYLAAARPPVLVHRGPRLLIVVVNRASPLEDPASVRLLVRSARALGRPSIYSFSNPFTHPRLAGPRLCGLELPAGGSPGGGVLRPFEARGAALAGLAPVEVVSGAYDVACGLEYAGRFRQAVTQSPTTPVAPAPPPSPSPPAPAPPTPQPPGCTPCQPQPGFACPLAPVPDVCIGEVAAGGERAPAGAR